MTTITLEFPSDVFATLRKSPDELAQEMRVAAAVQWYAEGVVSQGRASEIAGLSRAAFLDELARRKVSASQVTVEELREELARE